MRNLLHTRQGRDEGSDRLYLKSVMLSNVLPCAAVARFGRLSIPSVKPRKAEAIEVSVANREV